MRHSRNALSSAHDRAPSYNLAVPPYVRQALFSRSFDSEDLLPKLRKPALIIHGTEDAVVKPAIDDQHAAGIPHARVQMMPNAGHAPFWDDPATFNHQPARVL